MGRSLLFGIKVMLVSFLLMSDFSWFFTKSNFLPSDNFQELPTNLTMTLIKALEIRSNVCDDFSGLILFNKVERR
jgi:hypothetical protein